MPFGRFSGRILIELPEEYLFWFVGNGFPDGKLGFLMKLALELKANGADGVVREMARAMRRGVDIGK
ncbi:MAG: putative quorum-sensing-regulated virulence factor [Geminicoccaceae bacterium]